MDMDLYHDNLSLFNGDLLAEFPLADSSLELEGFKKDGLTETVTQLWGDDLSPSLVEDIVSPAAGYLGQDIQPQWMDIQVDLLDYFINDTDDDPATQYSIFSPDEAPILSDKSLDLIKAETNVTDSYRDGVTQEGSPSVVVSNSILETLHDLVKLNNEDEPENDITLDSALNDTGYLSMDDSGLLLDFLPLDSPADSLPAESNRYDEVASSTIHLADIIAESGITEDLLQPTLSPMSPEEVDSLLSSSPSSPASSVVSLDLQSDWSDSPWMPSPRPTPYARGPSVSTPRAAPPKSGSSLKIVDRKLRKKQQNKDAATRYRVKKKAEYNSVGSECAGLDEKNRELRERVDCMTREIAYMKELMAEVCAAKGLMKAKRKS